jgi:RNase P subunit RPR2
MQLAEMLDAVAGIAARLIRELCQRCDQLDPSGQLSSRIRVGVRPALNTPCLHCGAQRARFTAPGPAHCANCGHLISMRRPVIERMGVLEAGPWQWSTKSPKRVT